MLTGLLAYTGFAQTPPGPPRPVASFGVPQLTSAAPVPATNPEAVLPMTDLADAPAPAPAGAPRTFALRAVWDNGLRFESDDEQFRLHVGGNAQIDSTWFMA